MIETLSWMLRGLYSATALLAAGFALLSFFTAKNDQDIQSDLYKHCATAALMGLALSVLWLVTLAAELGGEWSAATDPYFYALIWSSPAAELILWRTVALLGLTVWSYFASHTRLGLLAAILVPFSFTRYGHALLDPSYIRSVLLSLHLCIIAWWFAAVPTLIALTQKRPSKSKSFGHRFGHQARVSVAFALLCGIALSAVQLSGTTLSLQNSYIQALLIKLLLVGSIGSIALFNYTRAFRLDAPNAAPSANRITVLLAIDFALFLLVFITSAWLTGPASNMALE